MKKFIIPALALTPMLAFAQQLTGIENFIRSIGRLVNISLPIVVGIALLFFFWGLVGLIRAADNAEAKEKAKSTIIWSVIALFAMVSVWGLVQFVGNSLGITQQGGAAPVPRVQGL